MANKKPVKKDSKPDILFISGSPRNHSCVALVDFIEQGAQHAGAKTQRFLLSDKHINPCIGCGGCNRTGNCAFAGQTRDGHFVDDYLELKAVLERVDAVVIVAPLYFAGPPAQLKSLYDRMQPYWAQRYLLGHDAPEKRPAQLFVLGGGGDAHGYAPLVGSTKSAMAVAGFTLEKINNFIGFSAPTDVPVFPHDDELKAYSHAQLAQIKRIVARQEGLVQRAIDAGGALARFVVKKKQATDLARQLAAVEAELEILRTIGDVEKAEQTGVVPPGAGRVLIADHKGDLQAEIDLDYSNLISRTPREGSAAPESPGASSASAPANAGVAAAATDAASTADAGTTINAAAATDVEGTAGTTGTAATDAVDSATVAGAPTVANAADAATAANSTGEGE
ncbi:MAG: flavodoxin family protein [Coriobacteriales bacterium]|jgi:multimeric flavodoxin WrbA|nr:flavodoxin family protein [Coriobacteriales bacterium]